jgi:TetR/AcrR family transcriptional regulator
MDRKSSVERREEILDAAARLLTREGVAALTIATIAKEVGVTSGALFRHFETRDAILTALAQRAAARLREDLRDIEGDPERALRSFVIARVHTVSHSPSVPAMVLSPDLHLALPPEGRAALAEAVQQTFAFVTKIIVRGQQRGVFRRDITPQAATTVVLGSLALRALTTVVLGRTPASAEESADVVVTLLRDASPTRKTTTTL